MQMQKSMLLYIIKEFIEKLASMNGSDCKKQTKNIYIFIDILC